MRLFPYFPIGAFFGAVLYEAEAVSWFRIQEMFRFDAFQMYGIIATAVLTAFLGIRVIKAMGLKDASGEPLGFKPKQVGKGVRYAVGGTIFGVGWSFTGACPGPMVVLVAGGLPVMLVAILSALVGTWVYGALRPRLPH